MINWNEFEHTHVIKKLKHILGSWWSIETVFTNDKGQIRGSGDFTKFSNSAVKFFIEKQSFHKNLSEVVQSAIEDIKQTDTHYKVKKWELTGLDVAVFPIIIEGDLVGTVLALGFFEGEHDKGRLDIVGNNLSEQGASVDLVAQSLSKLMFLKGDEKLHFIELVDLVAKEIVTLHLEISSREHRINELNKELGSRYKYDNMIGKSRPMQELYTLLDKIKNAESTVLVQGENGTGKELIAKSIHFNSPRKDQAFVIQNCSAFNDNLLESELFGHVKGAFTGAVKDKKGLLEIADRGTFFLDEIGDTSPAMQVKLLRVLQEGTFIPVGSTRPKHVDIRIIAATNKDLKDMVEKGSFREDLYYRLNVINLKVPPLRERKGDIPLLIDHFLSKCLKEEGSQKVVTKRAMEKLLDHSWQGNVRELQNEIERLVVLAGSETKITADMLSERIRESSEPSQFQGAAIHGQLKDAIEELEHNMIKEGLLRTGWNKSKLAKELGISRASLIMKVEKYGLDKRRMAR